MAYRVWTHHLRKEIQHCIVQVWRASYVAEFDCELSPPKIWRFFKVPDIFEKLIMLWRVRDRSRISCSIPIVVAEISKFEVEPYGIYHDHFLFWRVRASGIRIHKLRSQSKGDWLSGQFTHHHISLLLPILHNLSLVIPLGGQFLLYQHAT